MPVRPRFDPKRSLIAARAFTFLGRAYSPGDPFPHADDAEAANDRLRARQYEARAVNFAPEDETAPEPVQIAKSAKNGYYDITAPWLERPLTIRGKVNAEKAFNEMREEGPPLGWIDGGTEVEIEESGGGWYAISAPWLDEPEKVQGREAAEARQRELHDAGAPTDGQDGEEGGEGEDGATSGDSAQSDTDAAAPASEGAQENAAKAETNEGATGADAADQASDTASDGDDADKAAGGDQADAPAEGEAGKSEDPPADA